jgi:hypothetical protein
VVGNVCHARLDAAAMLRLVGQMTSTSSDSTATRVATERQASRVSGHGLTQSATTVRPSLRLSSATA